MATISAGLVKDLREKTGAGMMDCKNALSETNGDIEAAIDWLRKKGSPRRPRRADGSRPRVSSEWRSRRISASSSRSIPKPTSSPATMTSRPWSRACLRWRSTTPPRSTLAKVLGAHYPGGGTVSEAIANAIATIGENMTLRRAQGLHVAEGAIGHYVHRTIADGLGRIGVIVGLKSAGDRDRLAALGRQLAMHVAAASPVALDAAGSIRRRSSANARCSPRRTPASPRTCSRRSSNRA